MCVSFQDDTAASPLRCRTRARSAAPAPGAAPAPAAVAPRRRLRVGCHLALRLCCLLHQKAALLTAVLRKTALRPLSAVLLVDSEVPCSCSADHRRGPWDLRPQLAQCLLAAVALLAARCWDLGAVAPGAARSWTPGFMRHQDGSIGLEGPARGKHVSRFDVVVHCCCTGLSYSTTPSPAASAGSRRPC